MSGIRLKGTGSALPRQVVTNRDLQRIVETDDAWIVSRTGIRERRKCRDETQSSLAEAAARALADEGFQVTAADLVYDAADVSGLVNGCDVVLFGAPTINRNAPEAIWHAVHAVDAINTKGRAAGAFGSFGWTGEAADMLQAQLAQLKFKTLEKPFKVCFRPTEADLAAVADYARAVAALTAPAKPAAPKAQKYVCSICGYIYDPEQGDAKGGVAPGTPFESLPADWVCPLCRMGREMFKPAP